MWTSVFSVLKLPLLGCALCLWVAFFGNFKFQSFAQLTDSHSSYSWFVGGQQSLFCFSRCWFPCQQNKAPVHCSRHSVARFFPNAVTPFQGGLLFHLLLCNGRCLCLLMGIFHKINSTPTLAYWVSTLVLLTLHFCPVSKPYWLADWGLCLCCV